MNKIIALFLLLVGLLNPIFGAEFFHEVESVNEQGSEVQLTDGTTYRLGWWYANAAKEWQKGDKLKISYQNLAVNPICLDNQRVAVSAWGSLSVLPYKESQLKIAYIANSPLDPDPYKKIVLNNGLVFSSQLKLNSWSLEDDIIIFHGAGNKYHLWNLTRQKTFEGFEFLGVRQPGISGEIEFNDILNLEFELNQKVLFQTQASEQVATHIQNYCAGVSDLNKPIANFLFIGPTGVGKTELAKALTQEIFRSQSYLLRFDMSHFTEKETMWRLLGPPAGYVGHYDGGELTEALKKKPRAIVLLDEIEKSHAQIRKAFLPIFDEGIFTDPLGRRINCRHHIFIMTSNLCSTDIVKLTQKGYSDEEILKAIEPILMHELSPELYNRVQPVLFRPLAREAMGDLVDMMLRQLTERIYTQQSLKIIIDDTVREYLMEHGYHSTLGARPLKKLIETKVVSQLSRALLKQVVVEGTTLKISYDDFSDTWSVEVLKSI